MILNSINRHKGRANRSILFFDDGTSVVLHTDAIRKNGLTEGCRVDRATLRALLENEEIRLATEKALSLLARRLRSVEEIRGALKEREFSPPAIDAVTADLLRRGELDDARFAKAYLHDLQMRTPSGRMLIIQKLRKRGLSARLIDDLLASRPPETEAEEAYAAAEKLLRRYSHSRRASEQSPEVLRQKVSQALSRRGFRWDQIFPALKRLFETQSSMTGDV